MASDEAIENDAGLTIGSDNLFADLGLADAGQRLVKTLLSIRLEETLKAQGLSQRTAAKLIGISQPKLSNILKGRLRGVSEMKLMECLAALGRDVAITVGPPHEGSGRIRVLEAKAA